MLLTELTGVKHLYKKTRDDLFDMLAAKGIKCIGSGKYGTVFSHDSWNYVLKIMEDDPHYLAFVDWALKHPSIHFPKFVKKPLQMHTFHTRRKRDARRMWVVKIEKLYPIQNKQLIAFLVRNLENAATHAWRKHNGYAESEPNPNYQMEMPDGTVEKGVSWATMFERFPWLESLGLTYANFWDAGAGCPDIHSGNIMQRKDGTIVLTDPVWEGETPYQAYDKWVKSEMDMYADEYDDDTVSGPDYLVKNHATVVKQVARDWMDEIPF